MNIKISPNDKNNDDCIIQNEFSDYTAGWNLSEYRNLLDSKEIGNGSVQWVLQLRQKFENLKGKNKNREISTSSTKSKLTSYGSPPSWYYTGKF